MKDIQSVLLVSKEKNCRPSEINSFWWAKLGGGRSLVVVRYRLHFSYFVKSLNDNPSNLTPHTSYRIVAENPTNLQECDPCNKWALPGWQWRQEQPNHLAGQHTEFLGWSCPVSGYSHSIQLKKSKRIYPHEEKLMVLAGDTTKVSLKPS